MAPRIMRRPGRGAPRHLLDDQSAKRVAEEGRLVTPTASSTPASSSARSATSYGLGSSPTSHGCGDRERSHEKFSASGSMMRERSSRRRSPTRGPDTSGGASRRAGFPDKELPFADEDCAPGNSQRPDLTRAIPGRHLGAEQTPCRPGACNPPKSGPQSHVDPHLHRPGKGMVGNRHSSDEVLIDDPIEHVRGDPRYQTPSG